MGLLGEYNEYNSTTKEINEGQEIKEPYIFAESLPADYTQVTDMAKTNELESMFSDYWQKKKCIEELFSDPAKLWANCTSDERDLVISLDFYGLHFEEFFTGSGVDDCISNDTYDGTVDAVFEIEIDGTGGSVDTFKWKKDSGSYTTGIDIGGGDQLLSDAFGVYFDSLTGHTIGDKWTISAKDAGANTDKVTHLVTVHGKSPSDSVTELQKAFAKNHVRDIQSCRARLDSVTLYEIIGKYLSFIDAKDFFQTVRNLYIDYKDQGIKGTKDGMVGVALFDFIESTPKTIFESAGLSSKGYDMQNGDADASNFVADLMTVFRNGIYIK